VVRRGCEHGDKTRCVGSSSDAVAPTGSTSQETADESTTRCRYWARSVNDDDRRISRLWRNNWCVGGSFGFSVRKPSRPVRADIKEIKKTVDTLQNDMDGIVTEIAKVESEIEEAKSEIEKANSKILKSSRRLRKSSQRSRTTCRNYNRPNERA
jgi:hypothetical protein